MASEFQIVSSIKLNTADAMSTWNKFKSDTEKLKNIDLKIKVSGLDNVTREMNDLLSLVNKINNAQSSINMKTGGNKDTNSELKKQAEYLQQYKDTYRTIEKLKQQQSKGIDDDSFNRIGKEIDSLTGKLSEYKSKITDVSKIKLFEDTQANAALVKMEKSITDVVNKSEKLQKSFNSIEFKNVDVSQFSSSMEKAMQKVEELQRMATKGIDVHIELNSAINELNKLETQMKQLKELDSIKGDFASLEGSIKDALGTESVDKFRSEISQLESTVLQVDGAFDRLASSTKSSLKDASADITKMNSGLRESSRFAGDFVGSFSAYTLGNVLGDGIVRGIRGVADAFLEIDKAMTNVIKVADDVEVNTTDKLDSIKNKSIEVAKSVGQSSADTLNAIADTVQAGVAKTLEGSIDIAKQAMMFANVGELEQSVSSSMVNTLIRGFKIDPVTKFKKEVNGTIQEVTGLTTSMDALNFASNNYGASAEQLSSAIQNGGNVLGAYGVSLNNTVALMTSGIEVLGDGNKIGNGLKTIAINLGSIKSSASTGELSLNKTAKTLREVAGIDVYSDKKNGQIKDMVTILDELKGKWSDLTEEQQNGLSEALAGM